MLNPRMQTHVDFALLLFVVAMTVFRAQAALQFAPINCGNVTILNAPRGVIQTPNFPHAFPVPIRCRWVINKTAHLLEGDSGDGHSVEIYLYFTQLFVTAGLNISQYHVYIEDTGESYNGNNVLNSSNITADVRYVKTVNSSYLVVDFELDMLVGNHIRVLNNVLNVYGFNITYEISATARSPDNTCKVDDCSFLGHCYASADFNFYKCSCFDGFFGKHCGYGPRCHPGKNECANGASCRYAGDIMVHCECAEGFTGARCEEPVGKVSALGQCDFDEKTHKKQPPCPHSCRNSVSTDAIEERTHYFLEIRLAKTASCLIKSPSNDHQLMRIVREIEKSFLDRKIKTEPLMFVNSTVDDNSTCTVCYHFYSYSNSSAESEIRKSVDFVSHNGYRSYSFTLQKQPSLRLLNISSNIYGNIVPQEEEFILSCVAEGSPSLDFQWYKDDVLINDTLAVRGLWINVVSDNGLYRSHLAVERAVLDDTGVYRCQVKDWDKQQCRSISIAILEKHRVKIRPPSVIVERGANVSIQCLPRNYFDGLSYTWIQNEELVKMNVSHLYYEDLYLGGSILYVHNVQKSEIFWCNSASVRIDVLDKERTPYCQKQDLWLETGAGIVALQECPDNYSTDTVSRLCSMVDSKRAEWDPPDHSKCISHDFSSITKNFRKMILGYQNDAVTAANTLNALCQWLIARRGANLLSGEGEPILQFLQTVYHFFVKTYKWQDFRQSSVYFYKIIDVLLQNPMSILNLKETFGLSELIKQWTSSLAMFNKNRVNTNLSSFEYHLSHTVGQSVQLHPNISIRVDGSVYSNNESAQVSILIYKNLSEKLLSKYGLMQSKNGEQMYKLSSAIFHVLVSDSLQKQSQNSSWFVIDVKFQLPLFKSVCCGTVSSFGQSWNLDMCVRQPVMPPNNAIQCSGNCSGMFALFSSDLKMIDVDIHKKYHLVVMIGCTLCFFLCIITLCVLLFRWLTIRSCLMYLKIQICTSTAVAMLLFFYGSCDPSPDTFVYILSGLQMFLFISISSHISILIVTYIDIITLKNIPNIKASAISVITVSPMLLIIFAPFSRQITKEKELNSWWLCKRTLLFYIHIVLGLFFFLLFIFLYYSVMKKLFFLWKCTKVERRIIMQRISFLQCTLIIFATTAVMVISSTVYVNVKSFTSQCVFGSSCSLLGLAIFFCYFPKNEVSFCFKIMFPVLMYTDAKYSPELQVFACHSEIIKGTENYETESSSHSSQSGKKSENVHHRAEEVDEESSTKETICHRDSNSMSEADDESIVREPKEGQQLDPVMEESPLSPNKESKIKPDILWPVTKNNYISTSGCPDGVECCSPLRPKHSEILTTRVCVELGVLKNGDLCHNMLPDGSPSTVVICSVDVEPCPGHIVELNEVKFTTNAMGSLCSESIAQKVADPILTGASSVETNGNKTDVLDRISQDLGYLLNQSPSPPAKARRNLKIARNNSVNTAEKSKM